MDRRTVHQSVVPESSGLTTVLLAVTGVILLLLTLPAAMVGWFLLPEGRWPVVLAALPAVPFLWVGVVCLRKAGLPIDQFISQRPGLFGLLVGVGAMVALLVALVLGII